MGSITFVAVAKSLIPLNFFVSTVASQLSLSAVTHELPHGQCIGGTHLLSPPGLLAGPKHP